MTKSFTMKLQNILLLTTMVQYWFLSKTIDSIYAYIVYMCSMTRRNGDKRRKTHVVINVERQRGTTIKTVRISACRLKYRSKLNYSMHEMGGYYQTTGYD